jgi:hypothetical protein
MKKYLTDTNCIEFIFPDFKDRNIASPKTEPRIKCFFGVKEK